MARRLLPLSLVLLLAAGLPETVQAQSHEQAVEAAKQAAQEWLALIDADKYKASWKQAAASFRTEIPTAKQWAARVQKVHSRLDSLQSRSLAAARYTTSLPSPNTPKGEYVVVQYQSLYGEEKMAETVILTRDQGAWRVLGYFVKPT